jgi:GNAT superfamily N-acetyltransferase
MSGATSSAASTGDIEIRTAVPADIEAIVCLINAAFVVERVVIDGDRTDAESVLALMSTGKFLLAEDGGGLVGCAYIEQRGERSYLGLLSVAPESQGRGLGRQLVAAAEEYSREVGCRAIDLRIVSARVELLPFYRHLGYIENGTAPFPSDVQTKVPSHFLLMTKPLA